jgi:hypothetical protein
LGWRRVLSKPNGTYSGQFLVEISLEISVRATGKGIARLETGGAIACLPSGNRDSHEIKTFGIPVTFVDRLGLLTQEIGLGAQHGCSDPSDSDNCE